MRVVSRGGVPVYTDYKENIIVDSDHPILAWKAAKDRLRPSWFSLDLQKDFPEGLPKLSSVHSEDALTWNVFRTLQLKNRIECLTDIFMPGLDTYKIWFWGHDADRQSQGIDFEIQDVLNQMEPWGKSGVRQQTETDVLLRGKRHIVMVECKLGKPEQKVEAWRRSSAGMRSEYAAFMEERGFKLFTGSFEYDQDGNRFYQLFRNYLLGAALASRWNTKFSLLTIVNSLNSNLEGSSHQDEFNSFRTLLADSSNAFLITWQQICNALPEEGNLFPLRNCIVNHPLLGFPE